MFKIIKILIGLAIGFLVAILIVNKIDAQPSKTLKEYQKLKANHKITKKHISLKSLMDTVTNEEEIKNLRLDLRPTSLSCFTQSTCSDSDYKIAVQAAPGLLEKYSSLLDKIQSELSNNKSVTLTPDALITQSLFFSLDTVIRLQIIEFNYLYSKTNSDKTQALKAKNKALLLDKFITDSLYLPNFDVTTILLTSRLEWIRTSLQKYSPTKIDLPKIDPKKIIKNAKLGEFIVFSNTIDDLLKTPSKVKWKSLIGANTPTVMFSKNRTLNLYVELADQYAKADCIQNEEQKFCEVIDVSSIHPINPAGRAIVNVSMTSPLKYKKIVSIAKKINALNL